MKLWKFCHRDLTLVHAHFDMPEEHSPSPKNISLVSTVLFERATRHIFRQLLVGSDTSSVLVGREKRT